MRIIVLSGPAATGGPPPASTWSTTAPAGAPASVCELDALPAQMPAQGFVWMSCTRAELEGQLETIQSALQALTGHMLVDLHVSDLLSTQLPSHYDYTTDYDVLVFQGLNGSHGSPAGAGQSAQAGAPRLLPDLQTRAVAFAVFDRLVLSVHPDDCLVRAGYASRLLQVAADTASTAPGPHTPAVTTTATSGLIKPAHGNTGNGGRNDQRLHLRLLPASPADLMLRMVSAMVDQFLALRRDLSQQIDRWQLALLDPATPFSNWRALLASRTSLHQLEEICEDQRSAIQDWLDALEADPVAGSAALRLEHELLKVRSRDVLEHIERVVHHVHRMEQNAETAVQMHFSLQSNRANDIMRTLTVLTAVFLPLNLIASVFGMNFDSLPLIHLRDGFWLAMGSMLLAALAMTAWFWRRRFLNRQDADS